MKFLASERACGLCRIAEIAETREWGSEINYYRCQRATVYFATNEWDFLENWPRSANGTWKGQIFRCTDRKLRMRSPTVRNFIHKLQVLPRLHYSKGPRQMNFEVAPSRIMNKLSSLRFMIWKRCKCSISALYQSGAMKMDNVTKSEVVWYAHYTKKCSSQQDLDTSMN